MSHTLTTNVSAFTNWPEASLREAHTQKCKDIVEIFNKNTTTAPDSTSQDELFEQMLAISGFVEDMHNVETLVMSRLQDTLVMSRLVLCFHLLTFRIGWDFQHVKRKAKELQQRWPDIKPVSENVQAYWLCRNTVNFKMGKGFEKIKHTLNSICGDTTKPCELTAFIYHVAAIFHWICYEKTDTEANRRFAIGYFNKATDHINIVISRGGMYMKSLKVRNLIFLSRVKSKMPWTYTLSTIKLYVEKHCCITSEVLQELQLQIQEIEQLASDLASSFETHFRDQIIDVKLLYLLKGYLSKNIQYKDTIKQLTVLRTNYEIFVKQTAGLRRDNKRVEYFQALMEYIEEFSEPERIKGIVVKVCHILSTSESSVESDILSTSESSVESDIFFSTSESSVESDCVQ